MHRTLKVRLTFIFIWITLTVDVLSCLHILSDLYYSLTYYNRNKSSYISSSVMFSVQEGFP